MEVSTQPSGTASVRAQATLSVLKKSMTLNETITAELLKSLPPPPNPEGQGKIIDTYA
jgi:hypothetical protein